MKKRFLLISALIFAGAASAQFTNSNAPVIGDSIQLYIVDSTASNLESVTGDGVTWDYTNLIDYNAETRTIKVVTPQESGFGTIFTNSDEAIQMGDQFKTFFTNNSTKRTSQGIVFNDPELGDLIINLTVKEGDYYSYPFDFGDQIKDSIEGTASFTYNSQPINTTAVGVTSAEVDGRGTLKMGLTGTYNNVLRYHIIDTIRIAVPIPTIPDYIAIHEQFEYYNFSESSLPIFTHTHLWFGQEGGAPRNDFNLVLSKDITTTGLAEENQLSAKIYPNPATDYINIQLPNSNTDAKVEISDALGRIVFHSLLDSENSKIDVSELKNGTYFVRIKNIDNKIHTQMIVLN